MNESQQEEHKRQLQGMDASFVALETRNSPMHIGSLPFYIKGFMTKLGGRVEEGDIVNLDITSIVDGWYGDQSETFLVGQVSPEAVHFAVREITHRYVQLGDLKPGAKAAKKPTPRQEKLAKLEYDRRASSMRSRGFARKASFGLGPPTVISTR